MDLKAKLALLQRSQEGLALLASPSNHSVHLALSSSSSSTSSRVRLVSVLAARFVTTSEHLSSSAKDVSFSQFTSQQEQAFARLQLELNSTVLKSVAPLTLLHLTPRLLLIDPVQEKRVDELAADALIADLETTSKAKSKAKKKPPPVEQEEPAAQESTSPTPEVKPSPPKSQDLSELLTANLNLGRDDEDSRDGCCWQEVGAKASKPMPRPLVPRVTMVSSVTDQEPEGPPAPETGSEKQGPDDEVELVAAVPMEAAVLTHQESAAPAPAPAAAAAAVAVVEPSLSRPASSPVAMVTKQKYDEDLRELRLFFEEQLQVMHMRVLVLQGRLEEREGVRSHAN